MQKNGPKDSRPVLNIGPSGGDAVGRRCTEGCCTRKWGRTSWGLAVPSSDQTYIGLNLNIGIKSNIKIFGPRNLNQQLSIWQMSPV